MVGDTIIRHEYLLRNSYLLNEDKKEFKREAIAAQKSFRPVASCPGGPFSQRLHL